MAHLSDFWSENPEWVTLETIRQAFKSCQLWERVKSGEFYQTVFKERHPRPAPKREPFCTWSQMLVYWTQNGQPLALVHQYLRPDGTIGGSGKPDPKRILVSDRLLAVRARRRRHNHS